MRTRFLPLLLLLIFAISVSAAPNQAGLLQSVEMVTPTVGWAVGETGHSSAILRTTDGGRTWQDVSPPGVSLSAGTGQKMSVGPEFLDARTAWAAVTEARSYRNCIAMARTFDGGKHWHISRFSNATPGGDLWIQFINRRVGFVLASSDAAAGHNGKSIYRTLDGGLTWNLMSESDMQGHHSSVHPLPLSGSPNGLTFRNAQEGWVTLNTTADPARYLYRTINGGQDWQQQFVSLPGHNPKFAANTYPPDFFGKNKMLGILGVEFYSDQDEGVIDYITRDGGAHWQGREARSVPDAETDFFVNFRDGWALTSRARLFVTHDSGRHWAALPSHPAFDPVNYPIFLDFLTPQMGWALVEKTNFQTSDRTSELRQTRDGGSHWKVIYSDLLPDLLRRKSKSTLKLPPPPTVNGLSRK